MRALLLLCAALLLGAGCATVRPEEKEFLADPAMSFTSGGMASRHEQHVLDNREGSSGAGTARGGGCGCN
jgi:Domain of unknown function (DUF4266)